MGPRLSRKRAAGLLPAASTDFDACQRLAQRLFEHEKQPPGETGGSRVVWLHALAPAKLAFPGTGYFPMRWRLGRKGPEPPSPGLPLAGCPLLLAPCRLPAASCPLAGCPLPRRRAQAAGPAPAHRQASATPPPPSAGGSGRGPEASRLPLPFRPGRGGQGRGHAGLQPQRGEDLQPQRRQEPPGGEGAAGRGPPSRAGPGRAELS